MNPTGGRGIGEQTPPTRTSWAAGPHAGDSVPRRACQRGREQHPPVSFAIKERCAVSVPGARSPQSSPRGGTPTRSQNQRHCRSPLPGQGSATSPHSEGREQMQRVHRRGGRSTVRRHLATHPDLPAQELHNDMSVLCFHGRSPWSFGLCPQDLAIFA